METVTSRDGTKIKVWRSGEGPPVLLVHGTVSDHTVWNGTRPGLEEHFTVYAMNRRGFNVAEPLPEHDFLRDFEDVAAVAEAIGEPVDVVGHSAGAICTLGAAQLTDAFRRLVLYEPPEPGGDQEEVAKMFEGMIASGRNEEVVSTFFGAMTEDIDALKRLSLWPRLVELAPTISRDLVALSRLELELDRLKRLAAPAVVLVGGDGIDMFRDFAEKVADALPDARLFELPGQKHLANFLAPDAFTAPVVEFLRSG